MTSETAEVLDPRVARTRRDVVAATSALLLEDGWDAVTHAAVARRAGYSKATVYAHWPTRLDLISASIDKICDEADHPAATGDLRADLRAALADFADDLTRGHLDRLLAGVVERANGSEVVGRLRTRLYETRTRTAPVSSVSAGSTSRCATWDRRIARIPLVPVSYRRVRSRPTTSLPFARSTTPASRRSR